MLKMLTWTGLILIVVSLTIDVQASDDFIVSEAWIPEAPPIARVMAGYMILKNNSSKLISVTAVNSSDFKKVEMHRTVTEQGMTRMVKLKSLKLPAQQQRVFKSGGLHLMLIGPKRKLSRGDVVTLIITAGTQQTTIKMPVREARLDDHAVHH